ncbi:DHH family phosphoesterase [Patescibacteria group bacterium]|nr:DHH family phosphoesterase [Patescibacteria group bacterium]
MQKIVVTTGKRFCDIDGLACVVAYSEIPEVPTIPVVASTLNHSITKEIREWPLNFLKHYENGSDANYVIVDVSEPGQFPPFIKNGQIIEIYDHHLGFEDYWKEKLAEKSKIEEIGACATLVWEEFKLRKRETKISNLSANLLYTAILSNTLNFQSFWTTERDKKAFEELKAYTRLPQNWTSIYYLDQEREVYQKPEVVLKNDTKIQNIKGMWCAFGQIELWNSRDFIKQFSGLIEAVLREYGSEAWILSSPCISEGRNYIYTKNKTLKDFISRVMQVSFEGNIGVTRKIWTRKEILQKIQ